jgi:hypothetical protein
MLPPFFEAIGSDRYLRKEELFTSASEKDHQAGEDAWSLYERVFGAFCETRLDPQFHRLTHPARSLGSLTINPADPVLIVGTGPSAARALPDLVWAKDHLHLVTSPRGTEWLALHGIVPDLVLVEHRTALDAHHSARHVLDAERDTLVDAAIVAADWRTPAALLRGVATERLFVPQVFPTWGHWPATLAAMAVQAGARRIGLVGIDLGTTMSPDPTLVPLARLLGLLARITGVETMDCGPMGARKDGWRVSTLAAFAARHAVKPIEVELTPAPSIAERRATTALALRRLRPTIADARMLLQVGLDARRGVVNVSALREAAITLIAWGGDSVLRVMLQETLGVSFLPRLWRIGIDEAIGAALWRPVVLATHELVSQAARLIAEVEAAGA